LSQVRYKLDINDNISLRVEKTNDPDYPGLYIYAIRQDADGTSEEIGCVLMEYNSNKLSTKVWNHESINDDPITDVVLYKEPSYLDIARQQVKKWEEKKKPDGANAIIEEIINMYENAIAEYQEDNL